MENSTLFIRGQVWFWEDPVYGRKENNSEISIGEATLRYSRYCIIAQTTDTIDSNSVLVIPCSSSNHTPHDVPVPLTHLFHDNFTYARTKLIFPVHPKFLQRYICTLHDDVMKQVEIELIKMLVPSIVNIPDAELSRFNLNLQSNIEEPIIPRDPNLFEINVKSFIKDHLVIAGDDTLMSSYELKDAFDQYCMIHKLNVINDIVEFLEIFTRITNNNGYHFQDKQRYNVVEFRGLKIRGKLKLSILMTERDIINPVDPQRPGKWDDDSISEFLNVYNTEGIDAASEKFALKPSTATNYWYKWKDKMKENNTPVIRSGIPSTTDIPKSISKVSNMIRDRLKHYDAYALVEDFEKDPNKHLDEDAFYAAASSSLYYSLLDLLSIRKDDSGKFFIPLVNENSKYLQTWHFFDKVYHDRRISVTRDGDKMLELYFKYFPNYTGIDFDWIQKMKHRLKNRMNLNDLGIMELEDMILRGYCKSWK